MGLEPISIKKMEEKTSDVFEAVVIMSKRAERRHHKQRMIKKASRARIFQHYKDSDRNFMARKHADHMKRCSCQYSCGNIRRNDWVSRKARYTRQERKSHANYQSQLHDLWIEMDAHSLEDFNILNSNI